MGILGIFTLLAIAYAISNNRKKINYKLVAWGLSIQLMFALLILKSPLGKPLFSYLDKVITTIVKLLGLISGLEQIDMIDLPFNKVKNPFKNIS